jgi:hypothetical protein
MLPGLIKFYETALVANKDTMKSIAENYDEHSAIVSQLDPRIQRAVGLVICFRGMDWIPKANREDIKDVLKGLKEYEAERGKKHE